MTTPRARNLFVAAASALLLVACASQEFDDAREWRLRECEKILHPTDRKNCIANTPNYID